jgi:phage FluMu gp28-like protein
VEQSKGLDFHDMRYEVRIRVYGTVGRIKVLAANPRTARGFSDDLILDEFAFHEDSAAIWEAAEPILASNRDFLCRIASTGNGRHNAFYRMVKGGSLNAECGVQSAELGEVEDEKTGRFHAGTGEDEGVPDGEQVQGLEDSCESVNQRVSEFSDEVQSREETDVSGGTPDTTPETGVLPGDPPSLGSSGAASGHEDENAPSPQPSPPMGAREVLPHGQMYVSTEGFVVSRVTRTMAHGQGVEIFDMRTRQPITPEVARAQALDTRAYDQNYECAFADENMTLLSHELITAAERCDVGIICETDWPPRFLQNVQRCFRTGTESNVQSLSWAETEWGTFEPVGSDVTGRLYVGFDVGRKADLSVITVVEKLGNLFLVRGILRMRNMRLPDQELRLGEICRLRGFQRAAIDMTGLGLGLFEYAQKEYGYSRIHGINFASTVPATQSIRRDGRKRPTVRVTEAMATELLRLYEDRRIRHPRDAQLRDDLRKPERVTSPGGRVSIAATRDEAGHADHFWSLALAIEAAGKSGEGGAMQIIHREPKKLWL